MSDDNEERWLIATMLLVVALVSWMVYNGITKVAATLKNPVQQEMTIEEALREFEE